MIFSDSLVSKSGEWAGLHPKAASFNYFLQKAFFFFLFRDRSCPFSELHSHKLQLFCSLKQSIINKVKSY